MALIKELLQVPEGYTVVFLGGGASLQFMQVPCNFLLKKAAGITSGSSNALKTKVGSVTHAQLLEIAKTKEPDLTGADAEAMARTIAGSARSMGLEVKD